MTAQDDSPPNPNPHTTMSTTTGVAAATRRGWDSPPGGGGGHHHDRLDARSMMQRVSESSQSSPVESGVGFGESQLEGTAGGTGTDIQRPRGDEMRERERERRVFDDAARK